MILGVACICDSIANASHSLIPLKELSKAIRPPPNLGRRPGLYLSFVENLDSHLATLVAAVKDLLYFLKCGDAGVEARASVSECVS